MRLPSDLGVRPPHLLLRRLRGAPGQLAEHSNQHCFSVGTRFSSALDLGYQVVDF
jgi:hypothetical protein